MAHPQIAVFARLAKENVTPARTISGQKTLLARSAHDIRYDSLHDEIVIPSPHAQAILVFRGGASGEESPIRVLQGPHTQLMGGPITGELEHLDVDAVHNEIFAHSGNSILVYPREANGDVPPLRIIEGPDTQLDVAPKAVAVDPVHNLLFVATQPVLFEAVGPGMVATRLGHKEGQGRGNLLVFNRTDRGNVKPRAVIGGLQTGIVRMNQLQTYPPKEWIIITQQGLVGTQEPVGTFVGAWNIHDNGDVPPRWILRGPKSTLMKPRGVAVDPKHKELIVADMRLNAILTFYFPEMF